MTLKLYNTLTREKAEFKPIDAKNVRMYVCGPTVYDFAHIGNARPVIVFDVLFRLLRHIYGESHVTYVRNITDVDDKINARALRDFPNLPLNEAIARVTEKTANQFHADVAALGCLRPTHEPRATDNIAQMIAIIKALVAKGHAYVAAGEVLFDTTSMPDYGQLSQRRLEDQQAGARVEVEAHKKSPGDFVLWKLSSPEEPGWESPWGRGRPGWHIECSAMSERYLGPVFDIHGGGLDLIFPHHENEIAQSRCAHGTNVMANVWMHNGFLQVEGEKMSKSLGNFVTINELLSTTKFAGRRWPGNALRLAMLDSHYRQPINWTGEKLRSAENELRHFTTRFFSMVEAKFKGDFKTASDYVDQNMPRVLPAVIDALADDLNTPAALAVIRQRYGDMERSVEVSLEVLASLQFLGLVPVASPLLNKIPGFLGEATDVGIDWCFERGAEYTVALLNNDTEEAQRIVALLASKGFKKHDYPLGLFLFEQHNQKEKIAALIAARLAARKDKNFKESDRIRDELAKMGIALKDSKDPKTGEIVTTWEVAR